MGHTNRSQRIVFDSMLSELGEYGKSLREEDKRAFNDALSKAMLHFGNVSFACSYNAWALVLFSIILEQEKEIIRLKEDAKLKDNMDL